MNPILAEVYRSDIVESCHRGSAIVVDSSGKTVLTIGNSERQIYPRSALKPLQAIALLESGAAEKFELSDKEIALACASHNAEQFHIDALHSWLHRLGLTVDDLECGADLPMSDTAKLQLLAERAEPSPAYQNCSGKHCGMLTLARHLGVPTNGYSEYHHPTQQIWMKTFSELLGIDATTLAWQRDGCGLPALCMPMATIAYGYALFANPAVVRGSRGAAMARIMSAIQAHPQMLAGSGRCCTDVIQASAGSVVVKTGAEGVYAAALPELGLGLCLKIDDGASRGSAVALGKLLLKLTAIDSRLHQQLGNYFEPIIYNTQNKPTGKIIATAALD